MDMKDADLRKYYQASLKENPPQLNECPDLEIIIRSFSKESNESEKIKVVDHISACGMCYKKFEAVRQILKETKNLSEQFEGLSLSETEVRELKQRAQKRISEIIPGDIPEKKMSYREKLSSFLKAKPAWKFATALAALFIMAAAVVILLKLPRSTEEGRLRGSEEEKIQLIYPRGETQGLPLAFEWQPVSGAKEYQVVLLDEELTRVWTSEKTDQTNTSIPLAIRNTFIQEKIYYWKVMADYEDSTQKESDLQKFVVVKNPRYPD